MEPSIPNDLVVFIRRYIHRLETLEVLALLQSTRGRSWSAKEVSDEMRSSPVAAETVLATLVSNGLVAPDGARFSFRPATPELDEQTRRLLACYKDRRTGVIAAIFSAPAPALLGFAEASRSRRTSPMADAVYALCAVTSAACTICSSSD